MTAANNTRQMQTPGSTTAGGGASVSLVPLASSATPEPPAPRAGLPVFHQLTISSAIAVALNPTSMIAVESSATPPSWTNGNNGPCD